MTQAQGGSQRFSEPKGLFFTCILLQLWPGVRDKGTNALFIYFIKRRAVWGRTAVRTFEPLLLLQALQSVQTDP